MSDDDDFDADPSYNAAPGHADLPNNVENVDQQEESLSDEDGVDVADGNDTAAEGMPRERVFWKKSNEFWPLPPAPEAESIPENALNLPPESYVSKYIPEDIFSLLTEHTNRRFLQEKGTELGITVETMRKFIAVTVKMSLLNFPRIRMYWAADTRVPFVASQISRDLYFKIRAHLKLVSDAEVSNDEKAASKFWKVGPLMKSVQVGCLLNPRKSKVAVDEQMIPFWGHAPARQVIKTKPNPCGLKNFVVAAADGLPLDFFFYQGKGDPIVSEENLQHLDVGGKAVLKLIRSFPSGVSIYLDRFFTSQVLLDTLFSEAGATGTGTLSKKKVPHASKLKKDSELKREGRGSVDQSVRSDGQVAIVKWYDSRPVHLISNKEGAFPLDTCRRWCRTEKKYIEVSRPNVVKAYNTEMGGIDLLDRMISYYRIDSRTKKWTVRVIMHFFDFALAAGWIEYRRDQHALGTRKKDIYDLFEFRKQYAHFLVYGKHEMSDESSDSDYEPRFSSLAPHKRARVAHPPDALQNKNVLHMPEFSQPATKNRCRMPGCSNNKARIRCSTCKVFLCLQEKRNCFQLYHNL